MRKRNPVARAVRDPKFRKRVVRNKRRYTRKGRPPKGGCTQTRTFGETII